nr:hypothetical protein FVER53263_03468 [Fusarium verticillioides]
MPLRQLYPDPKAGDNDAPRQSIDIIADHGLGPPAKGEAKHAFDTWRTPSGQKGRSWLQQDLPDHIPDSRIFLYQYNTTAAYGRSLDGFRSKADNLLEAMSIERRECPGRPILLLGHNTGGLLIKQALINAHRNPGYNAIKDDTTGIVFFGTPHELITQKLGEIVTAIAREIGHETEGDLLRSLQAGSTFSELESWKHQVLQHNTVSFWGSSDTTPATEDSAGLTTPIGLKIVVENLKRLYELTIEKPESQYDAYPDTSGVETPLTSEDYGQDEHHDVLEEIQRVALSTTCEIDQPIMTPSQESRLQDDEPIVQDSLKTTCYHSTIKGAPAFTGTALQDRHIAGNQAIPLEAQDKLYSRMSFNFLILDIGQVQDWAGKSSCYTRLQDPGLDLPSSSMVINYNIPDADAYRYLQQVSRTGKAGRFGFAVNLVSDEKEMDDLQSVATSECFDLREPPTHDWEAVENSSRGCAKSQRF